MSYQTSVHRIHAGDIILMHFTPAFVQDVLAVLRAIHDAGLTPALLENYTPLADDVTLLIVDWHDRHGQPRRISAGADPAYATSADPHRRTAASAPNKPPPVAGPRRLPR